VKRAGRPASGFLLLRSRELDDLTKSFAAAKLGWASIPVSAPGRANVTASTSADDVQPAGNKRRLAAQTQPCYSELAQI
jgi:hypothetical protein